ncbi:MAG: uroporphyrinogen decarboxylase family protein [Sphaerochaetaceae bacterium]|jgi:uroporphyrinogen decarboxylase|nr:uroporphyrinogen decarboxylase family protein [Sphaerochaetaceae bacterium]MDD3941507.1 uroporphyrinogen decarboxylase family protein [Sphaerochaetaceae bacterium]MDX9939768.1 uroporphyrinogen decarboxylase family protein [Sphaerochaetaceae bacterium]
MTGKQRVFDTFDGIKTDKLPWVPFTGVHAGKLLGLGARKVSTDTDALVQAALEVNRLYHPDGQPVMFDLQIEAEILGCDMVWSDDGPPSVSSHPLAETTEIPTRIPFPQEGRLAMELEATRRLKAAIGKTTALYGVSCGPFTLASHLRGTEIFMDMMLEPEYVHELLAYTTKVAKAIASYLVEAGADVVAVTDPLISQISPAHFAQFMEGPFGDLFDSIRASGGRSSFFVCGNATMNIEPMCRTRCDSISVDENVNLATAKAITDRYGITLGGNIPLTSVMLFGNQQDNMKTVVDLIDSVEPGHLIISPGCDMPYDVPVENAIAAEHAVHETDSARAMVSNYESTGIEFTGTLPDYEHLEKPLVEVFTLDSATCAACTYMWAAAQDAVSHLDYPVDLIEYKYTVPQNIARCREVGVKQLPSIYINGKLAFSSIIPSRDELLARIGEVR